MCANRCDDDTDVGKIWRGLTLANDMNQRLPAAVSGTAATLVGRIVSYRMQTNLLSVLQQIRTVGQRAAYGEKTQTNRG